MKKKIAIVQLLRIGDLLQTCQAMASVRQDNPEIEFTLICREKFGKQLEFVTKHLFDRVIYLNTRDFFKNTSELNKVQNNLHDFVANINKLQIDVLINLSFSRSSEYLCSVVDARHKIGLYRDDNNQINIKDSWSQNVFSSVMQDQFNPFNLIDIYRKIIGGKHVNNIVFDSDQKDNLIVIHPFASEDHKRWSIDKWIELIYQLAKKNENYQIHIVGGSDDQSICHEILESPLLLKYQERLVSQTGKLTVEGTCNLLKKAKLFIGHDSMVSHLSAMTHTSTVVIALGNVRPHETAPYTNNAVVIAPRNSYSDSPKDLNPANPYISFNTVTTIANGLIKGKEINHKFCHEKIQIFEIDKINIYKTYLDENLGLELTEIVHQEQSFADIFRTYYRILWSFLINDQEISLKTLPQLSRLDLRNLKTIADGLSYYFELTEFGIKYSNFIINESESNNPSMEKIRDHAAKIDEIDGLCSVVNKSFKQLAPLVNYYYVKRNNISETHIAKVAKQSLIIFHEANNAASIFHELITQTLIGNGYQEQDQSGDRADQGEV